MPFPYVTPEQFERELDGKPSNYGIEPSEWTQFLTDKLEQESERVEKWTGQKWRSAPQSDVPRLIQAAVIRLTRSILNQIEEDGLTSESVGDHSEKYRPLSEIRNEVQQSLAEAGYEKPAESDGVIRNTNRTITITPDPQQTNAQN